MKQQPFQLPINGLVGNFIGSADAYSLSKCFEAYAVFAPFMDILYIGMDDNTGCMEIHLYNGVIISSCLGSDVHYVVMDSDTQQVFKSRFYHDAVAYLDAQHPMSDLSDC